MSNQPPYPPQPPFQGPPQYGPPLYAGRPQPYAPQYGPPPGQPGFGWGPQFPAGPGGPQQPPKKKSKAAWIAVPLVVVFAGIVGLWIVGIIAKQNRTDDYVTQPVPTSSYSPTYPPTEEPTEEPSTIPPTKAPTTAPKPTKTTPPPPRRPTPWEVASRDRIYSTGVQAGVGCRESKSRASSIAGARAYYLQAKACLDRAWPRQLRAAKDPFRPPTLVAMSGPAQTPCSGGAPSSFYCSTNETIYMDAVGDVQAYKKYPQAYQRNFLRAGMIDTVAHEYGHHVQYLSGTLEAYRELAYEASGQAKKLELARRKEIQATCFGAVFIGANKNSYPMSGDVRTQWNWLTAHSGDEYGTQRDHGSRAIQPYWVNRGFFSRNVALCNTFTATSDKVR